jgi:eukaryotic-like serine/threonine-protein kinase
MDALRTALGERYDLLEEVGEGATALVFRAHDRRFDRPVAVKVLRPELGASVSADRFLLEIETAARLQHPHILPIYDAGGADGIHFYVMPLAAGETLRTRMLRERTVPWADALRLVEQIASALSYAHGRQVVHRDIKPENILLHEGHAMVADFGIAKVIAGAADLSLTLMGTGIGTPTYMSPEQAFGEGPLDGRSDQYSLACVLYEMLEGRPPFSGQTLMAILAEKSTQTVRPLEEARSSVPGHVDDVLRRAMSHVASDRYEAVQDFVDALRTPAANAAVNEGPVASLAVLPFTNLGSDREDEFLSDGITEDLIHALAQIEGLRVAGRTSAFTFKCRSTDLREAGMALGVAAVLDGSLRRRGDRVRIVVHLTDVKSGFELWSDRFDRQFTDMFDVQDEISRSIVETLRVRLLNGAERLVTTPTRNMDAYEAYLRGRAAWNQRTISSMQQAREHLARALALDPRFAVAHAATADCFVTLALYGGMPSHEAMPAAERSIRESLALQPGLPEALSARASVQALYHWNWEAAERDYQQALRLGPSQPTTHHWYAMHLLAPRRRLDDAVHSLEQARQLDPLSPVLEASLGRVHFYARDFDRALALFDRLHAEHPHFGLAGYFHAQVLSAIGRHAEATTMLEGLVSRAPEQSEVLAALGVAYADAGEREHALHQLSRMEEQARTHYVSPVLLAQMHAALGSPDEAFRCLGDAVTARATDLCTIDVRPVFDPLRSDARYRQLLATLRL